jgi:hypothetical protein
MGGGGSGYVKLFYVPPGKGGGLFELKWEMALALLVAISGPQKVSISEPTPPNGPVMDIAHIKIITYRAILPTGTGTLIVKVHDYFTLIFITVSDQQLQYM